jgi:hypothetical protein
MRIEAASGGDTRRKKDPLLIESTIAAWTLLALALLGLAGVWATQLWSGKFKSFDRITLILGLVILMTLVLFATSTIACGGLCKCLGSHSGG